MGNLNLDMQLNCRDLGGIITKDGKIIKENMLIRSGELFGLSEDDVYKLRNHRLSLIVDFRTNLERREKPDPIISGVENAHMMIFTEKAMGITRENLTFTQMVIEATRDGVDSRYFTQYISDLYRSFISSPFICSQFSKFIDIVIDNSDRGSVLWHCTAGKDRAGFAAFLMLEILGVDRETVIEDYLLTNKYCKDEVEKSVKYISHKLNSREAGEIVYAFLAARRIYIESVYDEIEKKYTSVNNYFREALGVDDKKRETVRSIFLEDR